MAPPPLDPWPLLPRPMQEGHTRPEDEPARAAVTTAIGLAFILFVLRNAWPDPRLATEFTLLVAMVGCKLSFAITASLLIMLVGGALVSPLPMHPLLRRIALAAFDGGVHLALVLSVAGVLGVIVLHRGVTLIAFAFTLQCLLLVACYRTRLWLGRGSAA